jgi:hypothetical protein
LHLIIKINKIPISEHSETITNLRCKYKTASLRASKNRVRLISGALYSQHCNLISRKTNSTSPSLQLASATEDKHANIIPATTGNPTATAATRALSAEIMRKINKQRLHGGASFEEDGGVGSHYERRRRRKKLCLRLVAGRCFDVSGRSRRDTVLVAANTGAHMR